MQILLRKVCSTYTASYVKIEVRWDWGKVHRVRKKCQTVLSTWSGPLYSFGCHMMVLVRMPRVIDVQIAKFKFAKSSLAIFLSSIVFSLDLFCYKLSTHWTDFELLFSQQFWFFKEIVASALYICIIISKNVYKICFEFLLAQNRNIPYFRELFPPLNSFLPWIVLHIYVL